MKIDVLENLFATRAKLTKMIIRMTPQNAEHEATMKQLVTLRDRVTAAVNRAVEQGFIVSTADLEKAAAQLEQLNAQLDGVKDKVETLKTALDIAAKIAGVAAQIVGLV